MTLPPGRARLATKPAPTGSPAFVITMGMVVVALFAANAAGVPETTIRSTLRRTKSAASSGRRSGFCSANRYSMVIFFPSIHPSLLSSCRNAPRGPRYQKQCLHPGNLCGRFSLSAAPRAETQSAKSMAQRVRTVIFFFMSFEVSNVEPLLNDFIRPRQHVRRNRQADLLGGFEIDDELELRRLLDGKIGGLGAFQNLVDHRRDAPDRARPGRPRRTSSRRFRQNLREGISPAADFLPPGPRSVFDSNWPTGSASRRERRYPP